LRGPFNTPTPPFCRVAGFSPPTFYRHFDNIGECLLAAFEAASDCVMEIVSEACREEQIGWPERLGVAVASTLRFLAVEPATAHLLGTEPTAGERAIARDRQAWIERLAAMLAGGRGLRPDDAAELPAGAERHLVAGAVGIFSEWVAAGDVDRLPELAPELTEMLAAPYVS
jgi:AcrR family transcriptional regulator